MKLTDIDLNRLLPQFMRDDRVTQAFVYAIQKQLNAVSANIEYAKIYSRVDSMNDKMLDELAWQFNVVEYKADYDISVKRELIKRCMEAHHKRGTVASVEDVIKKIFGVGFVEEWFEYGGKPFHYKIRTSNIGASDEMIREIEQIVRDTQSVRSHLEEVIIEIIQSMSLYVGFKVIIMDDVTLKTVDVG